MAPVSDLTRPRRPRRQAGSLADVPYKELVEALRTQSLRAIARHYGVARNTVRYWRDKLGIAALLTRPQRGPTLQPQLLAWLQASAAGGTTAELAAMYEVGSLIVYRALRHLEACGQVYRTLEQLPGRWQGQARWHAAAAPLCPPPPP